MHTYPYGLVSNQWLPLPKEINWDYNIENEITTMVSRGCNYSYESNFIGCLFTLTLKLDMGG